MNLESAGLSALDATLLKYHFRTYDTSPLSSAWIFDLRYILTERSIYYHTSSIQLKKFCARSCTPPHRRHSSHCMTESRSSQQFRFLEVFSPNNFLSTFAIKGYSLIWQHHKHRPCWNFLYFLQGLGDFPANGLCIAIIRYMIVSWCRQHRVKRRFRQCVPKLTYILYVKTCLSSNFHVFDRLIVFDCRSVNSILYRLSAKKKATEFAISGSTISWSFLMTSLGCHFFISAIEM